MRRYLIIAAIVIVVLGIGVAAYFYFFASSPGVVVAPQGATTLPGAGQTTPPTTTTSTTGSTNVPVVGAPVTVSARLVQISKGPVVPGMVVLNRKGANASSSPEVAINYIERESGNVFSYLVNAKTLTRTSNKTIPGIQSASWLPSGLVAFVQYLSGGDSSTINTYALSSTGAGGGFFLAQNLADIAVSSTSVLTLASGVSGSTASLLRTDGTQARTVFSTPLSALRISYAGKSQYLAFTKAAATLAGNAFIVDGAGRFSRIAGPQNGLVALASPSGKWVLVSSTQSDAMQMSLVNTISGETLPLPVATIADKCVWGADDAAIYCGIPVSPPNATYPDDWYQGAVHFADRIWKIQVEGRYAQLVLDISTEAKSSFDVESPAVDALGTVLTFVNKNDGSLWSYSL